VCLEVSTTHGIPANFDVIIEGCAALAARLGEQTRNWELLSNNSAASASTSGFPGNMYVRVRLQV
jgi:hypothetical protein